MTKDEVRQYIALHGDARKVIDTIKEMQSEGIDVTEENLDKRLNYIDISDFEDLLESPVKEKISPIKVIFTALTSGLLIGALMAVAGIFI